MMKSSILAMLLLACVFFASCGTSNNDSQQADTPPTVQVATAPATKVPNKGDSIINEAIEAHGGALYGTASYSFVFRKKQYTFANNGAEYQYSVTFEKGGDTFVDMLENNNFKRTANGQAVDLSQKDIDKYRQSLNSVIYFATLPHKLADESVYKSYKGNTIIKDQEYHVVQVTFAQEGGGDDFEDQYHYWVNADSKTIDYLAYNYRVNKGGVRFRAAYNPRVVDGVRFQDYINYKAEIGTPLFDLPALYEKGELEELSRIDTENVINITNKQ